MDIDRFIASKLAGTFSYYKKIEMDGIEYYFEREEEYNTFTSYGIGLWSRFLSEKIIKQFRDNGFSIYFVESISEDGGDVADGTCIYGGELNCKGVNAILVQSIDNPSLILHEFGHFIDFCLSPNPTEYFSETKELKQIMLEEIDEFVKCFLVFYHFYGSERDKVKLNDITTIAHSVYYFEPREYFAETFAIFCMMPDYLKSKCPKTYEYLFGMLAPILWEGNV